MQAAKANLVAEGLAEDSVSKEEEAGGAAEGNAADGGNPPDQPVQDDTGEPPDHEMLDEMGVPPDEDVGGTGADEGSSASEHVSMGGGGGGGGGCAGCRPDGGV